VAKTIKEVLTYPGATVDQVVAMLSDDAYRAAVASYQRALRSSVTVKPTGAGRSVVIEIVHGTDRLPSFAQKLVGDEIPIVQEETWTSDTHADVLVTIPGKPGDMKGTIDLVQAGDDVVETVDLSVKVAIPLLGGKIEDLIVGLLSKAFRAEHKVGQKWLAGEWEPGR
jgi:hypothetical protein